MRWLVLLLLFSPSLLRAAIKVACVGDSITYGYKLANREWDSYPVRLQALLGPSYDVENFGRSGATLLRQGHRPYAATEEFQAALRMHPDIVVIDLGVNDTDPRDWPNYRDRFRRDYSWLIQQFRNVNPSVQVFVAIPTPIFESHPRFLSGTLVWSDEMRGEIPQIAEANDAHLIDLYSPLKDRPNLFPDAVHPDAKGAAILAKTVADAITGRFGGLQLPEGFGSHMVLPYGKAVTLQGRADRDEAVGILFRGQKLAARADSNGDWSVKLPAQKPGGPYSITVSTPQQTIHLEDILFGVVWLCSGQSNMDFPVAKAAESAAALSSAGNPEIRLFHLKNLAETDDSEWSPKTLDEVNDLHYFSGAWSRPSMDEVDAFSAAGYFFALRLQQKLHMPVGIVQISVGGSEAASWVDRATMDEDPLLVNMFSDWRHSDFIMDWCRERADKNLAQSTDPRQRHPYQPSYNFEAGIERLRDLPVDGVIWYQGESDAGHPELYRHIFPALVASWREQWGKKLPFFYVQLSGLDRPSWPRFRDEQRRELRAIPNSGMVVSYDFGDETNVHYTHKRAVGERLANLVLQRVYGQADAHGEGASVEQAHFEGQRLVLRFRGAGAALRTSDRQSALGFQIEDLQGNWKPVSGVINEASIVLDGIDPADVLAVAYAWEPFPKANVVNAYGLPLPTFLLSGAEMQTQPKPNTRSMMTSGSR